MKVNQRKDTKYKYSGMQFKHGQGGGDTQVLVLGE